MKIIGLFISLFNVLRVKTLECVSVINQKCMSRPKIIQTNPNEPVFYPLSIKINKCRGDCNNINDPIAKLCVPDVVKNMNIEFFLFLSNFNETRKIIWHETCKCVCRLTSAVCNDRQDGMKTNVNANVKKI